MGNTCAYGATGGTLFAAGVAGERLAVRNSGATVVVEGCGHHGCEYMTGGTVVVLGPTGINFAAGMTGGTAFVLDDGGLAQRLNHNSVALHEVRQADELRALVEEFAAATESPIADELLAEWDAAVTRFVAVRPKATTEQLTEKSA